ncbi:C1 family peptidase, partial [Pseudophaeobacter profundi]|uniref:C1 family peptidase n=1 Tax=Pseudophaeobacter profundi TaxID=3034152 RepID=UPI0034D979F7
MPKTFDARTKWSTCVALQEIRDQGPCGSCWAVAATAALTDRFCIATKTQFNGHLSVEDLLTCCCPCAVSCVNGCQGGYDDEAWDYFARTGICTGGDYKSKEGC